MGLGFLNSAAPNRYSQAQAVSSDGTVVVGAAMGTNGSDAAFRWTSALGMQSIEAILVAGGYSVAGFQLSGATGVSANGSTIVGPHWIANIPVNAFASFDLAGANRALPSLVWGGVVTNSSSVAAALTIGSDNSDATFLGTIGDGTAHVGLTKIGNGTQAFLGNSTYSGRTDILAGVLRAGATNVFSPNSAYSVASATALDLNGFNQTLGGLSGAGSVISSSGVVPTLTIASSGTLAPGNGMAGSTISIAANLALQSGAAYLVQVSPTDAMFANVSGTTTLAGNIVVAFGAGNYVPKTFSVLHASAINGKFDAADIPNLPNFVVGLTYAPTDVYLNLTATLGTGTALDGNQQNVANAISNDFNKGGNQPPRLAYLFGLTGGALGNALSQLTGETSTATQQSAFQLGERFLDVMLDPFVDGRLGYGATNFTPDRQVLPEDIALAYAKVLKAPTHAGSPANRWSVWGTALGGVNRAKGDAIVGSHDVAANIYGIAAGADYRISRDNLIGFALAGAGSNWSLAQALGFGRSDAFQAGVYGKTAFGRAYFAGALAYTNSWFATNRIALGDQLTAKFNGTTWGGRMEVGYRFPASDAFGATPYAAFQAQHFNTPAYGETDLVDGGLGLTYSGRSGSDIRSEIGARFTSRAAWADVPVIVRSRLAWAHDWVSNPAFNATFQALPVSSFIVNGAMPASDYALASLGAELHMTARWSLSGQFDSQFAQNVRSYSGTATLRYTW